MKKFLFLLFLPLTLLSQDLKLDYSYISGAPFEKKLTILLKLIPMVLTLVPKQLYIIGMVISSKYFLLTMLTI